MNSIIEVLRAHVPHQNEDGRITLCSCPERGPDAYHAAPSPEARDALTFHRDADGNLVKDGGDYLAWAEHVAAAIDKVHVHVWTDWWPKNRGTLYRYCVLRHCGATEDKDVSRVPS